jgi:hypothetical protein
MTRVLLQPEGEQLCRRVVRQFGSAVSMVRANGRFEKKKIVCILLDRFDPVLARCQITHGPAVESLCYTRRLTTGGAPKTQARRAGLGCQQADIPESSGLKCYSYIAALRRLPSAGRGGEKQRETTSRNAAGLIIGELRRIQHPPECPSKVCSRVSIRVPNLLGKHTILSHDYCAHDRPTTRETPYGERGKINFNTTKPVGGVSARLVAGAFCPGGLKRWDQRQL